MTATFDALRVFAEKMFLRNGKLLPGEHSSATIAPDASVSDFLEDSP